MYKKKLKKFAFKSIVFTPIKKKFKLNSFQRSNGSNGDGIKRNEYLKKYCVCSEKKNKRAREIT